MASLGHQSLTPTNLGRVDEDMASQVRKRILTKEEILQFINKSDSELSGLTDNDYTVDKTYDRRILEGEPNSDESDEEKHGDISNGKTILDHPLPSKTLEPIHFIVLAVANS
ncbi:hypothetical protein TNCV_160171 [Trichonephila clavipes]|uniref:Uncharacterized protein n=1 Tax=Trichonephila clavipes TaxID=2585209 RepID=A0A8X6UYF0_TRICX|nr:hypothetical protein TNCV_160171 [Trichonephila clavipes]